MTEAEIMKALEICVSDGFNCDECPYAYTKHIVNDEFEIMPNGISYDDISCDEWLKRDLLDLINRKNAESEELKSEVKVLKDGNINLQELYQAEKEKVVKAKEKVIGIAKALQTARAEAIKEFAERVKETIEQIVNIMFDDNESKCRIEGCRYPSNIPCGNEICIEENKAFWKAKIDQIAKEKGVEL